MAECLSRKELYDLVWSEPLKTLCSRFGISDVALKKTCARSEIPTPPTFSAKDPLFRTGNISELTEKLLGEINGEVLQKQCHEALWAGENETSRLSHIWEDSLPSPP
jgi:hypothetical protein